MGTQAMRGLAQWLSNNAVAGACGFHPNSTAKDWPNRTAFLVDLAEKRLFNAEHDGIEDTYRRVIVSYVGFGDPEAQFVTAIATNFDNVVRLPITVPSWQLHAAVSATGGTEDDHSDLAKIRAARRSFYEKVTTRYAGSIRIVLLDLGRRPRAEFDVRSITTLLHTFFNGAVLRHLVAPEAFADGGTTVGRAALAMLLGMTEPDEPVPPVAGDLRAAAVRVALDLDAAGTGTVPATFDTMAELIRRASPRWGWEQAADVVDADGGQSLAERLAATFTGLADVWDEALRAILEERVDQMAGVRAQHPGVALVKIAGNLLRVREQRPALLALCADTRVEVTSPYLAHLEQTFEQLLRDIDARAPRDNAEGLLAYCIEGRTDMALHLLRANVDELSESTP